MAELYYRNEELSDIRVAITANDDKINIYQEVCLQTEAPAKRQKRAGSRVDRSDTETQGSSSSKRVLDEFPAHKFQLSVKSEVLKMLADHAESGCIDIKLEYESHLAALQSVFAAIYGVPGSHQHALAKQDQPTLIHSLVLADQLAVPCVSEEANALLAGPLQTGCLSQAAIAAVWDLDAWPDVLLPVLPGAIKSKLASEDETAASDDVKRMLLHVLGDLEEVWTASSSSKRDLLLKLPSKALQLLIRNSSLKVATEETVLYTVSRWVQQNMPEALAAAPYVPDLDQYIPERGYKTYKARLDSYQYKYREYQKAVSDRRACAVTLRGLSTFIRFPQLSPATLSTVVPQLDWLRTISENGGQPWMAGLCRDMFGNWCSEPRAASGISAFQFSLTITTDKLREQADELKDQADFPVVRKRPQGWHTTTRRDKVGMSDVAAFAGVEWTASFKLQEFPGSAGSAWGVQLGLFVKPAIPGVFQFLWKAKVEVKCCGVERVLDLQQPVVGEQGWPDFFDLGPMTGGWDAAAWASKQLPQEPNDVVTAEFTIRLSS